MNYLAHALLSFNREEILAGNMLGDFVKGKNYLKFPETIQKGILLHRFIDRATDEHPLVHEAMALFRPTFILSNGVFVDIFFDHFLANDSRYFSEDSLKHFTQETYNSLKKYDLLFDDNMRTFFSYMAEYNWLFHYRKIEGIERSIKGICKRYPRLGDAEQALKLFEIHFDKLQQLFEAFFPELLEQTNKKLSDLLLPD